MSEAAKYIRTTRKPALVHATVTRPYSHSLSDDHGMYRTKDELAEEGLRDVFNAFPKFLIEAGIITELERAEVLKKVSANVKEAMDKAITTEWRPQYSYGSSVL